MPDARRAGNFTVSAVVFDMDNTLFDLVSAKRRACAAITMRIGGSDPAPLLRLFMSGSYGYEHHGNIRDYLVSCGRFDEETYSECCREYERIKLDGIEPYPGIRETLVDLQDAGIRTAVLTDAALHLAEVRLKKTGLFRFVDYLVTPEISGVKKPHPAAFRGALRHLRTPPGEVLMVGDSPRRDISPARALGLRTAYAAYGDIFSPPGHVVDADFVLRDPRSLRSCLGLPAGAHQ